VAGDVRQGTRLVWEREMGVRGRKVRECWSRNLGGNISISRVA
jgi:hypothetical protein